MLPARGTWTVTVATWAPKSSLPSPTSGWPLRTGLAGAAALGVMIVETCTEAVLAATVLVEAASTMESGGTPPPPPQPARPADTARTAPTAVATRIALRSRPIGPLPHLVRSPVVRRQL